MALIISLMFSMIMNQILAALPKTRNPSPIFYTAQPQLSKFQELRTN